MLSTRSHRILIILWITIFGLSLGTRQRLAGAASTNLIWKPYLQQLTDSGVIILWVTQTGANPTVRYSTDTSYSSNAEGSSRSSEAGYILHRVELTGLQPDSTYYYQVYTDGEQLLPDETLFLKTAPPTGSPTPFTFAVFGDYGKDSDSQKRLRDQLLLDSFRFILTTGDNAYDSGLYTEFHQKVFQIYQDLFSKVGLFPALGNHDNYTDKGTPYLDIFDLPQNAWRSDDRERYYSFDYGNAHFVVLDSTTPLDVNDDAAGDDMFDWLRYDLSQTPQPWKIVALHHAAYSTGPHGSDGRVQSKLVPIFEAYGVDVVFSGHDHIYQRSQPLWDGQVTKTEQGGIVYVVSGAGSAASYPCGSAVWSATSYCSRSYGLYNRVTVSGNELTVETIDESGVVKDSHVLLRDDAPLRISGAKKGLVQSGITFAAVANPITVTLPITYDWQATGQTPVIKVDYLVNKVTFTWNTTGTQGITVTATSAAGRIGQTTHTVDIVPVTDRVFLPLVSKN